ncbi:MAG: PQQ-dependent sugar dehydrogenase [Vicinamibacteria bacterium]
MKRVWALTVHTIVAATGASAQMVSKDGIQANIVRPPTVPATPERVASLKVGPGFRVQVFADGLGKARMLAVGPKGDVYLTRREPGDLWRLRDADGDGRAEVKEKILELPALHGIAFHGGRAYLATPDAVLTAEVKADGTLGTPRSIARLDAGGGPHDKRTLAVGPDGRLYVSVGSTCNACVEKQPHNATMLVMDTEGGGLRVFASGLRNTVGFDWHPGTKALWGMDHGIDWLGDDLQPEELNRIEDGKRYGWPYAYGDGRVNPSIDAPQGTTKEEWAKGSEKMVAGYTAHAAPLAFAFYRGSAFPERFRNGAFVTFRGSWNRKPPSGYEIVFLPFDAAGNPGAFEPFLSGFLVPEKGEPAQFGRPTGLAVAADGSLLFADDENGVVYRVAADAR